jgi:uncharacterized protein YdaU (DUF1376 family)
MHHYPFNPGSYLMDTVHWDEDERTIEVPVALLKDIIYRRLIDLYMKLEAPLSNKETQWVSTKIRLSKYQPVIASVLKEHFELRDGFWHNDKCDREIERYRKKVNASKANGALGGRPTKLETQQVSRVGTNQGLTRTRTRKGNPPTPLQGELAREFDEVFWPAYPRKVAKPDALRAFAKARAKAELAAIMAGLQRHLPCDQWTADPTKIPHPSTWLNGERWNDTPVVAPAAGDKPGKSAEWHETREGLEARAAELGIEPYDDTTPFPAWAARVKRAAGLIKSPGVGLEELTGMAARRVVNG